MGQRFAGRTVAVTGSAAGLGRAFALGFGKEGARLILLDIDAAGLEETASLLREQGTDCSSHRVDLAVESEILSAAAAICSAHERIDVLINNAGLAYGEVSHSFETLSQEKWLRYFAVNTVAPLLLAQALRTPLGKAKGVILNQSSMASYVPGSAYGVTKAALNAMTFGMAGSFARDGVRVNAIAPGIMETPASRAGVTPENYAYVQSLQLLKHHGTPEDIVALGLFLASDEARFIDCEIVNCDAGSRLRGWRY